MMKNKILLGSVTLLSALMIAACGNGEKKATETTAAPTTEATTATPTTTAPTTTAGASSETKEVSLADTKRIGREDTGYVNVPKDWVEFKEIEGNNPQQYQYTADGYNVVTLTGYSKDQVKLGKNDTWGAELVANRLYTTYENNSEIAKIQGAKSKVIGIDAFVIQSLTKDGKYFFTWIFQKGDKVYTVAFDGDKSTLQKMFDLIEQTWGLDPKTPGK
ncbi:hypothetical protein [Granulicatella sp. 20925_1_45]|uniref:hypothetical protein n=1 Tax=Granulicatella sp. 20925_1_45 TaxID=3003685 RepID=UPI00352C79FA